MATLFDTISEDIKRAMLAKDKVALDSLRAVKKELLEAKTAPGSNGELSEELSLKIITKLVKQRRDAAQIFEAQSRPELAHDELAQVAILEQYLPKQMDDSELTAAIATIISEVGATGAKDMGRVMAVASKQLTGKAEGRLISDKVKQLLSEL